MDGHDNLVLHSFVPFFFCFPLFQTACQGEVSNGALQRGQKCALWECARIHRGTQLLGAQGWDLW